MARPLSRNIVILSWVSFFQDAATEMLFPVLPLFIVGVLGAPVAVVGLVEGLAEGVNSLMKGVAGRLSDRLPRRPLVAAGYATSATAKALIALATTWPFVLFCRVLDRVGKGVRTAPRDALISAAAAQEARGGAFGFHRAMDDLGAVAGPLAGLALFEALHHQLRPLFVIAVIPAFLSVALIGLVREPARPAGFSRPSGAAWAYPRAYWIVLATLTIFGLLSFSSALIIVRIREMGFSSVQIFLAYALFNLCSSLFSYPAGRLSDRVPRRVVFAAGLGALALAFLGFAAARAAIWGWMLFALYGVFVALTDGVGTAWVADLVPAERAGGALGLYHAAVGLAALVAGIWAGLLWGSDGHVPFAISGCGAAVLAVALFVTGRRP
ncbi:MAG TPA: MFS transporter [Candidatus Dormibacteraeota bacterium]|nr:MFS transporter [Candidatus Dormibacteraeota bacterium]